MNPTFDSSNVADRTDRRTSAKAAIEAAMPLEMLLEAARRARWDALHGPPRLRSGRFDADDVTGALNPPPAESKRPAP